MENSPCGQATAPGRERMILAATFIVGTLATYWSVASAALPGGRFTLSIAQVLIAMMVSVLLSGVVYATGALWAVLADLASTSSGNLRYYNVLHAWLVLVGPVVSLLVIPSAYATANVLHQRGRWPTNLWRKYGFASIVATIYLALNVISYLTDPIGGWSEVALWRYAPIPLHCVAVFVSWIVYVAGMDWWIFHNSAVRPTKPELSGHAPRPITSWPELRALTTSSH